MKYRRLIGILWPSFLVSGLAEGLLFTFIQPSELIFFGRHPDIFDQGIYTISFFVIWAFCATSSVLTAYMLPGANASTNNESIDEDLL